MTIAAHQPHYLPNLDYFSKMKSADIFVISTNVLPDRRGKWQMRNKIPTSGKDHWLTVPIYKSHEKPIKEIKICFDKNWQRSHLMTLKNIYSKKKGSNYIENFEEIYTENWERLADLNFAIIKKMKEILNIDTELFLEEKITGKKHENFIKIAKKYGADTYISGNGAKNYMTEKAIKEMEKENIKHEFIKKHLGEKYPYSTIHYLLTYGKGWVKNVI